MSYIIRPFKPEDANFVLDFWLRSFYSNMTGYKEKFSVFFNEHQKVIHEKNSNKELICLVACSADDPDIVMGFGVFGTDYTLHYVAVKEVYRKLGVCKTILKAFYKERDEITVSHWTKGIDHIKKVYRVNYNRYRFYQ